MAFAAPSQAASGDRLAPSDIIGQLLIIRPTEHAQGIKTSFGEKDGIRCDVAVLTQLDQTTGQHGVIYRDILWLQGKLVGALKRQIGDLVLGRMAVGTGKPGQQPPFVIEDATTDSQAVAFAEQWINMHPDFVTTLKPPTPAAPPVAAVPQPAPIPAVIPAPAAVPAAIPQPATIPTPAPVAVPAAAVPAAGLDPAVLAQLGPEAVAQLQALGQLPTAS